MNLLRRAERELLPGWLRALERGRNAVERTLRRMSPPAASMLELLSATWLAQAIVAAAQLGIPDVLADASMHPDEIAQRLAISADGAQRLLRALSQHGIFMQHSDGRFGPSPLSDTLRSDSPGSIRDFALFIGSTKHREHWSLLYESVATGRPCIPGLRDCSFFELTRLDPAFGALFGSAMSNLSQLSVAYVLAAYDFSRFGSIVDVGGGEGHFLAAILRHTPSLQGVLVDLPETVARATPGDLSSRLTIREGSFFEPLPKGHDAYLLKHVLHDWDDEQAISILARVREALVQRGQGALLVIELVLPDTSDAHAGKLFDLEMLLSVGGRERTLGDFERVFAAAGFVLTRAMRTASPLYVLEARLAED